MKAKLEFDLTDPDDIMSWKRSVKMDDMASVLWTIRHNFRKQMEYEIEAKREKDKEFGAYEALDLVMERINDLFDEHNLIMDDIY